jgi:hypothetical protein
MAPVHVEEGRNQHLCLTCLHCCVSFGYEQIMRWRRDTSIHVDLEIWADLFVVVLLPIKMFFLNDSIRTNMTGQPSDA